MIGRTRHLLYSTTCVSLAAVATCTPPDRTPPYAELAAVYAVEDERRASLPDELIAATVVDDGRVRAAAYRALGRHERPDWMEAISAGMRDPDQEVRVAAVEAIAQSAHRPSEDGAPQADALDRFTAALGGERSPRVRAAIALAAGRLGRNPTLADDAELIILEVSTEPGEAALFDPRSIGNPGAPLLDIVRGSYALARASRGSHPSRDELTLLLAELTAFGRAGVTESALDPAEPTLTAVRIRRTALATLLTTGQLSDPVVTEAARDADPGVRATLAGVLARMPDLPSREAVVEALADDPSAIVRTRWITAYGAGERPDGCAPLIEATRDPDPHVRLAALDALAGPCVDEDARSGRLLAVAESQDESPDRWHAAARATAVLATLGTPGASEAASRLAQHPNPFARAWAARAWASLEGTRELQALLDDDNANVRTAALAGLASVSGATAAPWAQAQLATGDPQLVMTAARVLEGSRSTPEVRDALFEAFSRYTAGGRETDRDPRMAILTRLGELGVAADTSRLRPVLEDYDPAIASAAAELLATWTGQDETPTPRPFEPERAPSAEELERLDGAHVELRMATGGTIRIALQVEVAPVSAARFARLVDSGALDGLTFHRVVPGFVIQGLSPGANEYAGHGAYSRDEIGEIPHWRGMVGVSTRGRDTGDAQIFVNLLDNLRLDNDYTIHGIVVSGMDVVDGVLEGDAIQEATLIASGTQP